MKSLPEIPPRCLRQFQSNRVDSKSTGLPYPEGFTSFALCCHCGHDKWRVEGNYFENSNEFVGPLFAVCAHCEKRLRIINTAIDGYNGEIGEGIVEDDKPNVTWVCDKCNRSDGPLIASFGYHFKPDADEELRRQDYFDAFILMHVCKTKRDTIQIAMFDCA